MRHRFTLEISVRPKNDVPVIELRRGAMLRLAKGTKKLLPSNLFDVKDPDDEPSEIAVTLVSPVTGEETLSYGHIENERFPGILFNSSRDIKNGKPQLQTSKSNVSYGSQVT